MKRWYLVYTKPRKETVATQNLRHQGFEVYCPRMQQRRRRRGRWIEVIEPLFPRYVFVRLRLGYDNARPIRYTTGVQDLVRFNQEAAVVPEDIVESLRCTADRETGLHYLERPLFEPGDRVVIDTGPLAGLKGMFVAETGQERVIILLQMLGRESRVTVEGTRLRLA